MRSLSILLHLEMPSFLVDRVLVVEIFIFIAICKVYGTVPIKY